MQWPSSLYYCVLCTETIHWSTLSMFSVSFAFVCRCIGTPALWCSVGSSQSSSTDWYSCMMFVTIHLQSCYKTITLLTLCSCTVCTMILVCAGPTFAYIKSLLHLIGVMHENGVYCDWTMPSHWMHSFACLGQGKVFVVQPECVFKRCFT